MSAERTHTELRFTRDARLLAGVRAAVEFIAARGGMSNGERSGLAEASEKAACGAMKHLGAQRSFCSITIQEFDDRMEIRIERPSQTESKPAPNSSADGAASSQPGAWQYVDRVLYDAKNGKSSVTLVKFFSKKPAAH